MISVYLKPTNRCNLHCEHCFVPRNNLPANESPLEKEVVLKLAEGLKKLPDDEIHIIWHGGEPLLFGVSLIEKYSEIIRKSLPNKNLTFSIQTNLIISENELDPLVEYCKNNTGGILGTSYDFFIRKYRGSHEEFLQKWKKNVAFIVSKGIFVNVVITVTKLFSVEDLFLFVEEMIDEYGVKSFHLERFTPSGVGLLNKEKLYLNDQEFFSFFEEAFLKYSEYLLSGRYFYLSPFEKMVRSYFLQKGAGCFSGDCMSVVITVNPDGSVYPCPDLAFYDEYYFGNLVKDEFYSIWYSAKRVACIKKQKSFVCPDCDYYSICHGGCPHHFSTFDRTSCKRFFETLVSKINDIYHIIMNLHHLAKE